MPKCQYCNDEIGYLPFKCNYCGFTFCKQHRLPENHECSFDLKHTPVVPTESKVSHRSSERIAQKYQDYSYTKPKQLKKYLKRQEKERKRTQRSYTRRRSFSQGPRAQGTATLFIILMIVVFSIIEYSRLLLESDYPNIPKLSENIIGLYIWRACTSPFVYDIHDLFGFFFLFIMIYFLWFMGKLIEMQRGAVFFIKFYFLCVGFKMLLYALLNLPFAVYVYPHRVEDAVLLPSSCANAAIIGLISLSILPLLNQQVTGMVGFLPMRMRAKTFLIIIVLLIVGPALLLFLVYGDPSVFVIYLPDLGGLIAAYLVVRGKIKL
ncbi:MAG: rhomboid family intramembrane serine protease [Promethearchaeota archaeon]